MTHNRDHLPFKDLLSVKHTKINMGEIMITQTLMVVLITMVAILMMTAKLAALGLLKGDFTPDGI